VSFLFDLLMNCRTSDESVNPRLRSSIYRDSHLHDYLRQIDFVCKEIFCFIIVVYSDLNLFSFFSLCDKVSRYGKYLSQSKDKRRRRERDIINQENIAR
jgi:hypothetical protein